MELVGPDYKFIDEPIQDFVRRAMAERKFDFLVYEPVAEERPTTPITFTENAELVDGAGFVTPADKITGETRKIFIEFLERSCTAEFSGFLLYKELGRRMKTTSPAVAEIFTLMSRDEARHAGFINKAMSDFNLALDLGFLTKNRTYT